MSTTEIPAGAELLTRTQTCALVQIKSRTLSRMISAGRFPRPIKLLQSHSGQVRFIRSEVEHWIDQRKGER